MIEVADRHVESMTRKIGYKRPNVDFRKEYIEDLGTPGILDDHHRFLTGKPMPVCGNTASMLEKTRFSKHFTVYGDRTVHYGPFDCAPASAKAESPREGCSGGACC